MNFNKKVLKNGLRLITVPMKDTNTVTVMVLVEAGSKYEKKDMAGISHFLEHMCFKATNKRPNPHILSTELDSIGAEYNAFTSQEYTGYYAKAHNKHTEKIIDIISDLYQSKVFDDQEIEREKGVIVEEIKMYEDMPQQKVQEVLFDSLYKNQPAGWSIVGTKETVTSIMKKDLNDYKSEYYVAPATVVVVSGNYDENTIEKQIEHYFSELSDKNKVNKEKVIEDQKGPVISIRHKKTDQTHMILAMRAYNTYDERNYTLNILSGILGKGMSSRLFQLLREKMGVCYYIGTDVDTYTDHGIFQIVSGIDTARIEEVIPAIMSELNKIIEEPVSEEELKKVKEYFLGKMALSLESSDSWAQYFGFQEVFNKNILKPEQLAERIQKITPQDIQKVAKEIIKVDNMTLAMVSVYKDEEKLKSLLKLG